MVENFYKRFGKTSAGVNLGLLGGHGLLRDELFLVEPHELPPLLHLLDLHLALGLLLGLEFPEMREAIRYITGWKEAYLEISSFLAMFSMMD